MFWAIGLIRGRRQVKIFTRPDCLRWRFRGNRRRSAGDGTGRREVAACEPRIGSAEGNGGKMMKNDIRVAERNGGCGDFTGNHFLRLFVRNQWVEGGLAHPAYLAVLCNIRVRPRRGAAVAERTGLRPPALRPKPSGKPARILGANHPARNMRA